MSIIDNITDDTLELVAEGIELLMDQRDAYLETKHIAAFDVLREAVKGVKA